MSLDARDGGGIDLRNGMAKYTLYEALRGRSRLAIETILKSAQPKSESCKIYFQLLTYILSDDIKGVQSLLETIADVDFKDLKEPSPLRFTVMDRNLKFVKMLLDRGANPNLREFLGIKSILSEVLEDFENKPVGEIIQLLLQGGALVNDVRNEHGFPPLLIAARINSTELLKLLIQHQLNLTDTHIAMSYALTNQNCKFAELLLRHGLNPNVQNHRGVNWLVQAIQAQSLRMVKLFIKHGAKVNLVQFTMNVEYPIHFACINSNAKMLDVLLMQGADLQVKTAEESNVLQYAARNDDYSCPLEALLKMNIFDVNYQNKKGETALHGVSVSRIASIRQSIPCRNALLLLKHGAKIDVVDKEGNYPHLLEICENVVRCEVLKHFRKLKLLNYQVEDKLLKSVFQGKERHLSYPYKTWDQFHELERLKNVVVCLNPRYSLFNILFMKKSDLIRFAENEVIMELFEEHGKDFEKTYDSFGFILNRVCRELEAKRELLIPAREKFCELIGKYVPAEIVNCVSTNLGNCELNTICQIDLKS